MKTLFGQFTETLNNPNSEISGYSFIAQHWWDMDKEELKVVAMEALYQLSQNQEADMLENISEYHEDLIEEED